MDLSRRGLMGAVGLLPAAAGLAAGSAQAAASTSPYRHLFEFQDTFIDAAFSHPMSIRARQAGEEWVRSRALDVTRRWPRADQNPQNDAKARFARLINASPDEIAVVPSTMSGENLVAQTLKAGLGGDSFGVVTDAFHYGDSLVIYGALYNNPPVKVVKPRHNRIDLADLDAAIDRTTKLVAVSMVASPTGFYHDIKALCEIAHRKGALVYADIIQAAGAVPIDVKDLGVDFACAGNYKWLMGDFGAAFLYVRPDRLKLLQRVQLGWEDIASHSQHIFPADAGAPSPGDWTLRSSTAGMLEVSTPAWGSLAIDVAAMDLVMEIGVEKIAAWRQPLIDRLQEALPQAGFDLMTPKGTRGPIAAFGYKDAQKTFAAALDEAKIKVTLYPNAIRISPSIYNDMADIERLIAVLTAKH